jgi:hypothetical protein
MKQVALIAFIPWPWQLQFIKYSKAHSIPF